MNCANHPDRERHAFCQNCGKPLCRECARVVGQAIFCEPCLEARLAAANAAALPPQPGIPQAGARAAGPANAGTTASSTSATYQPHAGASQSYQYVGNPYPNAPGTRPRAGTPNPIVAGLLGFIPGVGAMYNGQYAKGIVHLVVFAVLTSLADAHGVFGMFVAAWIFYQAIEAYQTATARREGLPLPNPFGLNDIAERFGFGRTWSGTGAAIPVPPPPAAVPSTDYPRTTPPPVPDPGSEPAAYPAYTTTGAPAANPYATAEPFPSPYPGSASSDAYRPVSAPVGVTPPVPAIAPSSPVPVGALVLIGLGVLFLVGNTRWLGAFPIHLLLPALLIGVGVWIFVRRMLSEGASLADDGTPGYQLRVVQALQGSIWVILVGVLFLLDSLRILSWGHSWPLFIIVGGVVIFLQRTAASSLAQASVPPTPQAAPASPTGAVPAPYIPRDAERP